MQNSVFFSSYVILWVIVIIQGFVFVELLRQVGELRFGSGRIKIPSVKIGTPFPNLVGHWADTGDEDVWFRRTTQEDSALVFVLSVGCSPCLSLAHQLGESAINIPFTVILVGGSDGQATRFISATGLRPADVVIDVEKKTSTMIGIEMTPTVLVVRDRIIAASPRASLNEVLEIWSQATTNFPSEEGIVDHHILLERA